MARTPNYSMERKDRDRAKAAKKAEKLAARAAAKEERSPTSDKREGETPAQTDEQENG
ncbi:MAG TPA: hypothetical protein VIZ90_16000 [Rhizobiaceae bacterium]